MKRFTYSLGLIMLCSMLTFMGSLYTQKPWFTYDKGKGLTCPIKFRITGQKLSGGGQFSVKGLIAMKNVIPAINIMIVDLREEAHGYMNGDSVSWYRQHNWGNKGKTLEEVNQIEKSRLDELRKSKYGWIFWKRSFPLPTKIQNVMSEEELVKSQGFQYYRLPITDHIHPSKATIDRFISFIRELPEDTWVHFHCLAGKGRSTTFLVMYDIIENAGNDVTLEEIIERHASFGGKHLMELPHKDDWKYPYLKDRSIFIQEFYQYAKENPTFELKWSEYKS